MKITIEQLREGQRKKIIKKALYLKKKFKRVKKYFITITFRACFNIEIITTKVNKYRRGKGKATGVFRKSASFFFIFILFLIFF